MTNLGYTAEEPIVAVASALYPAAIGIVRTSGKGCVSLVAEVFSRKEALLKAKGNTLVYGWILDSAKNRIDEVMLGVYREPKSFTGEEMVEIFCHGGVAVVLAVQDVLLKSGFRMALAGEFTFRAFINGKADLTRAEAVREIIDSKTDVSRSRAAGRLSGALYSAINKIKQQIIDTLAAIEVGIEYPEDEETIADSFDKKSLLSAKAELETLAASWQAERLYQDGIKVVICGKTNAGKSSIFNALLKEERAIVSSTEGTTRDWIEGSASFSGIPVRLFDTAGFREADNGIEAEGILRAKDLVAEADVVLYVVDSSKGLDGRDRDFIKNLGSKPTILLCNKSDTVSAEAFSKDLSGFLSARALSVSAKTAYGIGNIGSAVRDCVLSSSSANAGGLSLGSERQRDAVCEALERINHALSVAEEGYALDAVVQDLEDCLDNLGEVTGSVTADDVLDSVFSHFCVGK